MKGKKKNREWREIKTRLRKRKREGERFPSLRRTLQPTHEPPFAISTTMAGLGGWCLGWRLRSSRNRFPASGMSALTARASPSCTDLHRYFVYGSPLSPSLSLFAFSETKKTRIVVVVFSYLPTFYHCGENLGSISPSSSAMYIYYRRRKKKEGRASRTAFDILLLAR